MFISYTLILVRSSTSSAGTKYDPDLLKSDVDLSRKRVQRLKHEIAEIQSQMRYKEMGVESLSQYVSRNTNT